MRIEAPVDRSVVASERRKLRAGRTTGVRCAPRLTSAGWLLTALTLFLSILGQASVAMASVDGLAPSYGMDADCTVEHGMGVCWVGVTDLETGVELFRPHLSGRLGTEASWSAAAELDDGLYSYTLKAIIEESSVLVELVVERDEDVVEHLKVRMKVGCESPD